MLVYFSFQVKHFSNKTQDAVREQAGICAALWRCSSACPRAQGQASRARGKESPSLGMCPRVMSSPGLGES